MRRIPASNANRVATYRWLEDLLRMIAEGKATGAALDLDGRPATPLFVVAGACPNSFCGMQAVLYCRRADGCIDFWWVKPRYEDPEQLERNTLKLHAEGPFKNVAGSSRAVYEPLAQKFYGQEMDASGGDFSFGVDASERAYVDERVQDGSVLRMPFYCIWQEDWGGFLSRSAYVRGRLLYQRDGAFFARQYEIRGESLLIAPGGGGFDDEIPSLFPPDSIQELVEFE